MIKTGVDRTGIDRLQFRLKEWLSHNFPNTTSDMQLKGIMEELGELCHHDLKYEQGIRGYTEEKALHKITDAVGDIFIYLCNYCTVKNIQISKCIEIAFDEVTERDWIKNPVNGKTE